MILTDTHIHLYSEDYENDRDELIENAFQQNIERFFLPAIDSETTEAMYELEARYPENVFLMMGLHPTHVQEHFEEELKHVEEQFERRRFYAVGEIGIDLHWDKSTLEIQQEAFRWQIKLAKKYKLPIVIHCRKAFDEIFDILEEEKNDDLFGIFHCFTGNLEQAKRALSYNLKLGIGGVVTFKNGKIDKFLNEIPLSEIVLETDGPYLSPTPFRGKRNEPEYLIKVAEKLAEIYEKPLAEIAEITTQNSKDIFGI
ncbi:TatD family hydrolase [Salegentibacter salegens]|uniref:TatD DNase family protein n=1 Tax=Salegentibacter salegens TaxID=143223 RepID=A0A1M7LWN5_9FLAO|nr:TatD family hydrolase [Salegentibacter salegens]PRX52158.1 TatD DNase family protein [Salegentibacter salegens]SHM82180.1 TatD DNase family protein [Salegentibacter salegens]